LSTKQATIEHLSHDSETSADQVKLTEFLTYRWFEFEIPRCGYKPRCSAVGLGYVAYDVGTRMRNL